MLKPALFSLCIATAILAADTEWPINGGPYDIRDTEFAPITLAALDPPERCFQELTADHATRCGTNEQVLTLLTADGVMRRVTATCSSPRWNP